MELSIVLTWQEWGNLDLLVIIPHPHCHHCMGWANPSLLSPSKIDCHSVRTNGMLPSPIGIFAADVTPPFTCLAGVRPSPLCVCTGMGQLARTWPASAVDVYLVNSLYYPLGRWQNLSTFRLGWIFKLNLFNLNFFHFYFLIVVKISKLLLYYFDSSMRICLKL